MNLLRDNWIDVEMTTGEIKEVSLVKLFADINNIRDLVNLRPIQKVSLIRFLVCCIHGALDGPSNRKEWEICKNSISERTIAYLKKWENYFDMQNFLQVNGIEDKNKKTGLDNLKDLETVLGFYFKNGENEPVIFKHMNGKIAEKDLPKFLLAYQSFSKGGRIGSASSWGSLKNEGYATISPMSNFLISYIAADNLLDTLFLNLVSKEDTNGEWGKPIWEYDLKDGNDKDIEKIRNSYLGRLVPISKAIKIKNNQILEIQGIEYNNSGTFDAMLDIRANKKGDFVFSMANKDKHPWRYLYLYNPNNTKIAVVKNLSLFKGKTNFHIISTAMIYGNAYGTKLIDEVEWSFTIPSSCIRDEFVRYTSGTIYADKKEELLKNAIFVFSKKICADKKILESYRSVALSNYWSILNIYHNSLIKEIQENDSIEKWQIFVDDAAQKSYEFACLSYDQKTIKAFVIGERYLNKMEEVKK